MKKSSHTYQQVHRVLLCVLLFSATGTILLGQPAFEEHDKKFNYYLTNNLTDAEKELEQQSHELKSRYDSIRYSHNKVTFYLRKNDVSNAETWLKNAENLTPENACDLRANALSLRCMILFKRAGFTDAIQLVRPYRYAYPLISNYNQSNLSLKLANAYFRTGNIDSASYFTALSLNKAQTLSGLESAQIHSAAYSLTGEINLYKGVYDTACFYHLKALAIHKQANNLFGTASALSSLAGIMLFQEDYRKALSYYEQALPFYAAIKTTPYDVYNNIGITYEKLGQTDSALFYYHMAYNGAVENGRIDIQANAAGGLGNLFAQFHQYDSSVVYLQEAKSLFEKLNYNYGIVLCQIGIANGYLKLGNIQQAETFANQALALSEQVGSREITKQCYEILAILKKEQKQFEEAFNYYELFSNLRDSLAGEAVKSSISEQEVKYGTRIKKLENDQLKEDIRDQQQQQFFDRVLFGLAGIILVALLVILFLFVLGQKRKLRIRQVETERVRIQNELLTSKLDAAKDAILKKNEIIEELQQSNIHEPVNPAELSRQLLEKINDTQEWAAFMIEFNLLYQSFYERLQEITISPLTKSELRLAALIRLNLTNKEISALLNITVDAVKKAKNRLTKKLRIESEDSLTGSITAL